MALVYQHNVNENTRIGVWKIEEPEDFFLPQAIAQRQISHPNKRLQHLAGRYLLKFLFPGFPYRQIEVGATRKPFLPGDPYHFSISHCADYAAVIVSTKQRVGIDVEYFTARVQNIKKKFLHANELRFVNTIPAAQQTQVLTVLWSAKEAMYKWYGLGEVDFSEMMYTFPFEWKEQGMIEGFFNKFPFQQKLTLNYKLFDTLSLVWVVSEV